MMNVRKASVGLMLVALMVTLTACPKKATPPGPGAGSGLGTGGPGGQGLGSLDRYKQGLSPGEGGPLADVQYDYNSYDLRSEARSTLQTNAEWLKANPSARVEVEGHCDERGTVEYNLALGAQRAKSAKDYLMTLGISADRLSTISYGEELPVCRDTDEGCFERNRRAHFVVLQ